MPKFLDFLFWLKFFNAKCGSGGAVCTVAQHAYVAWSVKTILCL